MAARKVSDENRKLRELLSLQGIGEDSIQAYLQPSPAGEALLGSQPPNSSAPVQVLQQLLQTRRPFPSDVPTGLPVKGQPDSREGSLTSVSTANSPWEPNQSTTSGCLKTTQHPFMTPGSTTRSTVSSVSHQSHHSVSHHQRLAAAPLSRNSSPISRVNHSQMFELDSQLSQRNTYISHKSMPQQHLYPHPTPERTYIPTDTNTPNVSSCVSAADMIATMAGADQSSVSVDLGCMPGTDCAVDNQLVFNVMDRYSGTTR